MSPTSRDLKLVSGCSAECSLSIPAFQLQIGSSTSHLRLNSTGLACGAYGACFCKVLLEKCCGKLKNRIRDNRDASVDVKLILLPAQFIVSFDNVTLLSHAELWRVFFSLFLLLSNFSNISRGRKKKDENRKWEII